jgi:hypothetical protein
MDPLCDAPEGISGLASVDWRFSDETENHRALANAEFINQLFMSERFHEV